MSEEKRNDGGPAFPTIGQFGPQTYPIHGMSLRDWFAGLAMQGLLLCKNDDKNYYHECSHQLAIRSYAVADAMLKQRGES